MLDHRKKFKAQVAPSDKQLWAIGMVAVQWSQFEMVVHLIGQALLPEESPELAAFDANRSVKGRIEACELVVKTALCEPFQSELLAIFRTAKDLQNQRDRVIHNQWSGPAGGEAEGVFNWSPPFKPFEWNLDFGGIMRLAQQIDDMQVRLFNLWFSVAPRSGAYFTLRHSLMQMRS